MKYEKVVNLLSMAQRAKQVASGEHAVEKAFQEHKAELLLIAEDAAEETKAAYVKLAEKNHISFCYLLTREALGQCLGKNFRAAAVILDKGFSKAMEERIIEAKKN
jgi:ribosomal protein L7Ae-like RNA K-turn-binding protein